MSLFNYFSICETYCTLSTISIFSISVLIFYRINIVKKGSPLFQRAAS